MNKKISLGAALTVMAIVAALTFSITMVFSMRSFDDKMNNIKEREVMYNKLAQIDKIVRQNYYGDIDEDKLMDSIAKGYISGLGDSHSMYLDSQSATQLNEDTEGQMVGIGIEPEMDSSGYIYVKAVYPESPAYNSKLQKGDLIVKVDDLDVTQENYQQAVEMISGEAGTKVKVVVRRNNEDMELEMTRRHVQIPTVFSQVEDEVGYVQITNFNDSTPDQFNKQLDKLINEQGVKALVFDVRGNPGGTISSVSKILDKLLPAGDIVSATYKDGSTEVLYTSDESEVALPMVVIANGNSASAAELFTQALKDYDKAKMVGTQTYGKGSMQTIFKLDDGSVVDITVALYNPPKSPNYDGVGVKPDYEIQLTEEQEKLFAEGELSFEEDPQIRKAIEIANAAIKGHQTNASSESEASAE